VTPTPRPTPLGIPLAPAALLAFGIAPAADSQQAVIVHGAALEAQTHGPPQAAYGQIAPRRDGYDPASGRRRRAPHSGQIAPVCGAAHAAAPPAGSSTGARSIGPGLRSCSRASGRLTPVRYRLDAQGIGDDGAARRPSTSRGRGCRRSASGEPLTSDGDCFGYVRPSGATVMSGTR
jgi:hypothetical protein